MNCRTGRSLRISLLAVRRPFIRILLTYTPVAFCHNRSLVTRRTTKLVRRSLLILVDKNLFGRNRLPSSTTITRRRKLTNRALVIRTRSRKILPTRDGCRLSGPIALLLPILPTGRVAQVPLRALRPRHLLLRQRPRPTLLLRNFIRF